ncbi:MAG: bifunctional glutamate N-acetyltransferase/amino-acid acetyltransferase ArgJ [Pseudomonadota bacterium]
MAVNLQAPTELLPVPGVRVGSACAAIKQDKRNDLALFEFCTGTQVAGVYTQSHFAAAPVQLARARQAGCRSWVVNSGNANAATGEAGVADAGRICASAARLLQIPDVEVQPFSTGVIGERLPVERMQAALDGCYSNLSENGWLAAAQAIMTTDTVAKGHSLQVDLAGSPVTITGIAKGSGMIKPNMATMLAYVACDARIAPGVAQQLIDEAVAYTFNRVTVDGDTSTNDCFMLACTGQADHDMITGTSHPLYAPLAAALTDVALTLAQALARDGEGATKFVTVRVCGGRHADDCLAVAYTMAESPLVKTALFAGDANWGRFCMAIGRAPTPNVDASRVKLWLDDVQVADQGLMCDDYTDARGAAVLAQEEFTITVDLGLGEAEETVWTTDLSYEYIRINAEYRT